MTMGALVSNEQEEEKKSRNTNRAGIIMVDVGANFTEVSIARQCVIGVSFEVEADLA